MSVDHFQDIDRRAPFFEFGQARLYHGDCLSWLGQQPPQSIHAVVTDPPYGVVEFSAKEQAKLRAGKGGVWRIPPKIGGHQRSPLPRFTTLSPRELTDISRFFEAWATALRPTLVPGAHVVVASNPLVTPYVAVALQSAGLERRGELIRLVQTLRGGDRPKNAEDEFRGVSVMPRSQFEPWLIYREPIAETTVAENLRKWRTGGLARISDNSPFGDVIRGPVATKEERSIAKHPSLKPQAFMRQIVKAVLPLGEGTILDPFAGSGATLAAAEHLGYDSVGIELDLEYVKVAASAIPGLSEI